MEVAVEALGANESMSPDRGRYHKATNESFHVGPDGNESRRAGFQSRAPFGPFSIHLHLLELTDMRIHGHARRQRVVERFSAFTFEIQVHPVVYQLQPGWFVLHVG